MLARLSPVALAVGGVALLSVMDAAIKHVSADASTVTITFGRFFFGAFAALAVWVSAGRPSVTFSMLRTHALRGALICVSGITFFYALAVLPLAEAVTLGFLAPLLIPFAAWMIVGEQPRVIALIAAVVGFSGAVIALVGAPTATDSDSGERLLGLVAIFTSAVTYALSLALLRARAEIDGAPVVGLMQTVIPAAFAFVPAATLAPLPPLSALPWLVAIGILGASGWYLMINAYARAQAQTLAPIEYTALIWASLFGMLVFNEPPRPTVYLGAALIIGACLISIWAQRRASA